jgi:hypothetical protein
LTYLLILFDDFTWLATENLYFFVIAKIMNHYYN